MRRIQTADREKSEIQNKTKMSDLGNDARELTNWSEACLAGRARLFRISSFWIWDLGFGIWDLGFGIWDLGFGIWDFPWTWRSGAA
jgi:hypothetical protein